MMHIHRISIVEMLKLIKGQSQKVKGQGQTYKFVKKTDLALYHEPMIGYG